MIEASSAEPFVWTRATHGPRPYLLKKCDPFTCAEPLVHEVEEIEDGFAHRIIWNDYTGLKCTAPVKQFSPATLANMYRHARAEAEEIEFYASGAIIH